MKATKRKPRKVKGKTIADIDHKLQRARDEVSRLEAIREALVAEARKANV